MKRLIFVGCSALAFLCTGHKLRADTFFYFTSSPTSWIGQGQTLTLTEGFYARRTFDFGVDTDSVHLGVDNGSIYYELNIVGSGLTLPVVGFYTNATRWPFMGSGIGMEFRGEGRADNTLTGYFNVLQADYDASGQVAAFAVDFMQYDEGNVNRWNQGSIRYNSNIPIPEPGTGILAALGLAVIWLRRVQSGKSVQRFGSGD
jgi:hypothetical protein